MCFLFLYIGLSVSEVIAEELESVVKSWAGYLIRICFYIVQLLIDQ